MTTYVNAVVKVAGGVVEAVHSERYDNYWLHATQYRYQVVEAVHSERYDNSTQDV